MRSVPNHDIDDESLKENFYRGQDDNNKAVLYMIAGGSYGEFPYAKIAENWRKSLEIIKLRALGSQILGETRLQCNPHTTRP